MNLWKYLTEALKFFLSFMLQVFTSIVLSVLKRLYIKTFQNDLFYDIFNLVNLLSSKVPKLSIERCVYRYSTVRPSAILNYPPWTFQMLCLWFYTWWFVFKQFFHFSFNSLWSRLSYYSQRFAFVLCLLQNDRKLVFICLLFVCF